MSPTLNRMSPLDAEFFYAEGGAVTNRVSAVLANLPVGEADPIRRLGLIRQEMDQLKHTR